MKFYCVPLKKSLVDLSIFYYWVANSHTFSSLKQHPFILSHFPRSGVWAGLSWAFSIQGLTNLPQGGPGCIPFWSLVLLQVHVVVGRIHFFATVALRSLCSCWLSATRGLAVPSQALSQHGSCCLDQQGLSRLLECTVISRVALHHLCHTQCPNQGSDSPTIFTDPSHTPKEGEYAGRVHQRVAFLGAILEFWLSVESSENANEGTQIFKKSFP